MPHIVWSGDRSDFDPPGHGQLEDDSDVTFFDDVALLIDEPRPRKMLDKLRATTEHVVFSFAKFSMNLNFKKGKSEAVVLWRSGSLWLGSAI